MFNLLCSELIALKKEGIDSVFVSDKTLLSLSSILAQKKMPLQSEEVPESKNLIRKKEDSSLDGLVKSFFEQTSSLATSSAWKLPEGDKTKRWEWLRQKVLSDPACLSQVKSGKQLVFGVGNLGAEIFFCGEAPGAEEEIAGEPFVGPAGQLLNKIIQAMGFERGDVYIANIVNFRPPMPTPFGNRAPTQEEMDLCLPYLRAQIEIVAPKVIVALGGTALSGLLGPDPKRKVGQMRGTWSNFMNIPVMITYHPSYLLRNSTVATKKLVWSDMQAVMKFLKKNL
jgi:uracil-DNA glycosylase